MKTWLPWVLFIAAVGLGLFAYDTMRADRAAVRAALQASESANAALKEDLRAVSARVEASEAARAAEAQAAAKREAVFLSELARIRTATPQQLVDDGARLLEASDITTDGRSVTMGVETWRKAVTVMLSEETYRTSREPSWKALAARDAETIAALKEGAILADKRAAGLEATIRDLSRLTSPRLATLQKALYAGAGFALGTLVEKVASRRTP
jgi:hypothetical protein